MKLFVLAIFILLTSCSKGGNEKDLQKSPEKEAEIVRSLEASAAGVTSPSGSSVDAEEIIQVPFGIILNTESKSLSARIRNGSTAGEILVSATRIGSENPFTQTSSSCNNIKPKSTCDIRMSFNGKVAPQNAGGDFSGQWILTFSDNTTKTVQMNINVEVPVPPSQEEIDAQIAAQISNVTFTPSGSIEIGELSDKESKTFSIQIKNNNTTPVTFPTSVQAPFTLITGCSTISAKGTCTARISLSGAGKEGQQLSSFSYGTKSTPLSAFVKTTAQIIATTPLVENILESSDLLDFGSLKPSDTVIRQVVFTNKSNLPVTLQTNLSNPSFSIISNSCNNSQIAINSSCIVRLSLSGAGKSEGPMTGTLTYGTTGSVNLSANILSEAELEQIALEQAQLNSNIVMTYGTTTYSHQQTLDLGIKNQGVVEQLNFNLKNTGTAPASVSQVSFASNLTIVSNSCNTTLSPNASCQIRASLNPQTQADLNLEANLGFEVRTFPIAYTLAGPNVACTPENALNNGVTDMSGVLSVSGNLPNCVVSSCNETSHTLLGLNQSRCGAISYQPVYSSYGTCDAPVCGGLASGSQSRTYTCNRLVDGANPNPVSESFCSSFVSDLSISCDSPAGTVENIITGGSQTLSCSAGSTVQTFQSVACDNGFEQVGNICELIPVNQTAYADSLIIGGFAPQTYSTSLVQFVGFSNPQNVSSVMFYEGISCSGNNLASSLVFGTFYQVTLSPGEGTRTMSARVYNSILEPGNCVNASIIVDTIAPSLSTTLASTTTNLAIQAPNISFTYSDSGTGIESLRYYVSKMPYSSENYDWNQSPALQGLKELLITETSYQGIYDPTLDENFNLTGALFNLLPYNTPLYIIIEVKDFAGNYSYQSKEFTSTENLEFSFKYADYLPLPNEDEIVTYYLNKAFINQYYFASSFGIEEYGDTKQYLADIYYNNYLPSDEASCLAESGTWDANYLFCDFSKDTCLSKGFIYASKGDGQAPVIGQGHCGSPQFKVGFNYADPFTSSGNQAYNDVLASFEFFRDQCLVTDGILSCTFPLPTPPAATEGYVFYGTSTGIKRFTYDKATDTLVSGSSITLNNFVNNTAYTSLAYANGYVYIGSNLAGNSSRIQRISSNGGSLETIKDYPANFSNASVQQVTACNNKIYYSAITNGASISGLFSFDTNLPISSSNPGTTAITNNINKLTCSGTKLYYIGPVDSSNRGIHVVDTATNIRSTVVIGKTGSLQGNSVDQYEQLVIGKDYLYYLPTINDSATLNIKKVRLSDNVTVQTISTATISGTQGQHFYLSIGVDKENDDLYLVEANLANTTSKLRKYNGSSTSDVGAAVSGVLADYQPEIMVSNNFITWRGGNSNVYNLAKTGTPVSTTTSSKVRKYKMYDGYYFLNLSPSSSSANFDGTLRGANANSMSSLINSIGDFDIVDKP